MAEMLYPYQSSHCLEDTIHIWLYVDPAPGSPECLVAPILLPRGTWNLVWSLVTLRLSASSTPAIFTDPPNGITLEDGTLITVLQEKRISETQYWMQVANDKPNGAEEKFALLSYAVSAVPRVRHVFDPTIIVSQEPFVPPHGER